MIIAPPINGRMEIEESTHLSTATKKNLSDKEPFWKVSPNPFKNEINITLENTPKEAIKLKLFSVDGQLLFSEKEAALNNNILIDNLNIPPGIYFLHLQMDNHLFTKKIVKIID